MSSKILDFAQLAELQPRTELTTALARADQPFQFMATDVAAATAWQARVRTALAETVGWLDTPCVDPEPEIIEQVDKGDYVREKVLLRTGPDTRMPVYLLIPKGTTRALPCVLALHGHGYGVKDIVGLWEDGAERDTPDGYHKDFGVALCRRGFAVAAPEISCFGERRSDFAHLAATSSPVPSTCTHSAFLAFHLGRSLVGLRVRDGMRLVDYLETRPEFDTERLGSMGISGGGMHAFFSSCLDTRIKASVVSGYFCYLRECILAMNHCPCNIVPGLAKFGEMTDLAGLIAPRPMLVEAGIRDVIFPVEAVKAALKTVRPTWELFGKGADLEADIFDGRHQISGARAYDFLAQHLDLND